MTVHDLMSKLAEVSMGNPDLEVEVHVTAEGWETRAEMEEDAKAGEEISIISNIDTYAEDFLVEQSRCGMHRKVCICVPID